MHLRDKLINDIRDGIGFTQVGDNSNKSILARGCDPEMGRRAVELIPPILGMPEMVAVTNDDDFIRELQRKKWSVVHFAPGACRYNASKSPIPGSRELTNGWGFEQYRELVRKYQGEDIKIIETTDESQIVPLLRKALAESKTNEYMIFGRQKQNLKQKKPLFCLLICITINLQWPPIVYRKIGKI